MNVTALKNALLGDNQSHLYADPPPHLNINLDLQFSLLNLLIAVKFANLSRLSVSQGVWIYSSGCLGLPVRVSGFRENRIFPYFRLVVSDTLITTF